VFRRIAVVNRGEPAMRLIRAVRELNAEHGSDTRVLSLHTEAERRATFVRAADEAVVLRETGDGSPYLDHRELARALHTGRADAAWVGWGFVAEDPAFAELCADLGVTFIGPSPEAMRLLGAKVEAKLLAEEAGVPVAPWSRGPVAGPEDGRRHAQVIGYPLIVKARSGGGGRGIRVVRSEAELEEALLRTRAEAERTFGDPVVFMERLVEGGRHVEVQVIADRYGSVWAPGVRDCSVQRRNQKVLEESSSPTLTAEQDQSLRASSIALVKAVGYVGAATVEFLFQPDEKLFTFLEVNTRLQVEHPVTEETTGLDLVKLQLHVAAGGRLAGDPPEQSGHAVEARLSAEDAEQGFAPAPGQIELMRLPTGPGVRVDTGFSVGDVISPLYDSMIAKVIARGRDRPEALARLRCAVRETGVLLRGGTTTKSFLLDLLDRPEVVAGTADTGWLDRTGTVTGPRPTGDAWAALVQVAIDVADTEEAGERAAFLSSARGGRPRAPNEGGRPVELGLRGQVYRLTVAKLGRDRYRVELDGRYADVEVDRLSPLESRLSVGGKGYPILAVSATGSHLVEVDGVTYRVACGAGGVVHAPAPAVVVALRVVPGQDVEPGQTVAVLESMKMETALHAPFAGRVREVLVRANARVDAGTPLLSIERAGGDVATTAGKRVALPEHEDAPAPDPGDRAFSLLAALQALITGYDVSARYARQLVEQYATARGDLPDADETLLHGELAVLTAFADVAELSGDRPASEEADQQVDSPREYFHAYLHSLDAEREGLPQSFRNRLRRALRHYDVEDLDPGPGLQEAVHRIFLAQQRVADQLPAVLALLEHWRGAVHPPAGPSRAEVGDVLDRLVVDTQVRFPAVGDLARAVRYRYFEEPVVQEARQAVLEEADRLLAELDEAGARGGGGEVVRRIETLVASPEPLIRLLAQRFERDTDERDPVLEMLTRRYYRRRSLENLRSFVLGGNSCVTAGYDQRGTRLRLVALMVRWKNLPAALSTVARLGADVDSGALLVDLYVSWPDRPTDAEAMATELHGMLAELETVPSVRRVTVTVCTPEGDVETVTFRPSGGGLAEDRLIRGLHPLTAQRLAVWRLKNFDGERLPSAEDTYLFHVTAKENPNDERFIAMAEVRDLTPLRDEAGEIAGFPTVERQLTACLDSLRRARSRRCSRRPLENNRVVLYAWPSIEVPLSQVTAFARAAAPLTVGAGLVVLYARLQESGEPLRDVALRFSYRPGTGVQMQLTDRPTEPMRALDDYTEKVLSSRTRGAVYPYELAPLLAGHDGSFVEHDLDDGRLVPVDRPPGQNRAGIVVGVVSTPTKRYREGVRRVALFGDPTKQLGTVAEPECARVNAALDLAQERGLPVEWFALSSGARISMDSGTENMDWIARALRRIIEFTKAGGEINIVVAGINVGAQPYWNAEATMLMHTKGILVMTPDSAMVLTGKRSLDYSGGVSAEDNFGIGGYDRVMGPNGQAQFWAPDLTAACGLLLQHYEYAYVAPGERWARPADTSDPRDRDVRAFPHRHPSSDFTTVADIFSADTNPERKKPFDIRTVMRAVTDQDHPVMERWAGMADADTAVVQDACLGGHPVTLLGIESHPMARRGSFPADGPDQWTAGTLFPGSSKKTARAINAASGNRPLVVLANLSGFDGSPDSLRNLQMEYGAEIGRAIVNFDGPIVFCVISRYHGGASVVFSGVLNDNMEVLAVRGSYAPVIGGAPAAAVVFSPEVDERTAADPRKGDLEAALGFAGAAAQAGLRTELADLRATVRSEKLGDVAAEFEAVHDVERVRQMGSVHAIISAAELRPRLIEAVERGMERVDRP